MRNFIFLFLVTFIFPFICNSSEANDVENIAISLGLEKGAKLTEISRRIEYLVNKKNLTQEEKEQLQRAREQVIAISGRNLKNDLKEYGLPSNTSRKELEEFKNKKYIEENNMPTDSTLGDIERHRAKKLRQMVKDVNEKREKEALALGLPKDSSYETIELYSSKTSDCGPDINGCRLCGEKTYCIKNSIVEDSFRKIKSFLGGRSEEEDLNSASSKKAVKN